MARFGEFSGQLFFRIPVVRFHLSCIFFFPPLSLTLLCYGVFPCFSSGAFFCLHFCLVWCLLAKFVLHL